MPRIAEARAAAEPVSELQKQRHRRILRAAARLGALHGLERVQVHDVAAEAGVAIGTLYRYFPSKTHLFIGVLRWQVDRLDQRGAGLADGRRPVDAVADLLLEAGRELVAQPLLALAMLHSNISARADALTEATRVEDIFRALILRTASVDLPNEEHQRLARLVLQCWYGVLVGTLHGRATAAEAEADLRLACGLLLASWSTPR